MLRKQLKRMAIVLAVSAPVWAQSLSPDLKGKVDAKLQSLKGWSTDPQFVSAVKAFNSAPPAEAVGMTADKWKSLSLLDPAVRSFTKNPLGQAIKAYWMSLIAEVVESCCRFAILSVK